MNAHTLPPLTPEQLETVLDISLISFRNGYATSLANIGVPPDTAFSVGQRVVDAMKEDPVVRNQLADGLAAMCRGEKPRNKGFNGIALHVPGRNPDGSQA